MLASTSTSISRSSRQRRILTPSLVALLFVALPASASFAAESDAFDDPACPDGGPCFVSCGLATARVTPAVGDTPTEVLVVLGAHAVVAEGLTVRVDGTCELRHARVGDRWLESLTVDHEGLAELGIGGDGAPAARRTGVAGFGAGARRTGPVGRAAALVPFDERRAMTVEAGGGAQRASAALELLSRTTNTERAPQSTARADFGLIDTDPALLLTADDALSVGRSGALSLNSDIAYGPGRSAFADTSRRSVRRSEYLRAAASVGTDEAHAAIAFRSERAPGREFDGVDLDILLAPDVRAPVEPVVELATTAGSGRGGTQVASGALVGFEVPLLVRSLALTPRVDARAGGESRHRRGTNAAAETEFAAATAGVDARLRLGRARGPRVTVAAEFDHGTAISGLPADAEMQTGLDGSRLRAAIELRTRRRVAAALRVEHVEDALWGQLDARLSGSAWSLQTEALVSDRGDYALRVHGDAQTDTFGAAVRGSHGTSRTTGIQSGRDSLRGLRASEADGTSVALAWWASVDPVRVSAELVYGARDRAVPLGGLGRIDVGTRRPDLGFFALAGHALDADGGFGFAGVRVGSETWVSWAHTR